MIEKTENRNQKTVAHRVEHGFLFSVFYFRRSVVLLAAIVWLLALAGGCRSPESPPKQPSLKAAPAQLERGRYLAENVLLCFACHSQVDWKAPGAPVVPGTKGVGAPFPEETLPFPLVSPNITSDPETGAGWWTDEQLARAIREGIGHDGRVLFPGMPYPYFHALSDEDLASVIAYLRSLPPLRNSLPKTPLPDEFRKTLRPLPVAGPVPPPDLSGPVERGKYLVVLAQCGDCHTPLDGKGQPMGELAFAGGRHLEGPWGEVASANITPDSSGISYYDEKRFFEVMRTGRVGTRELNPVMLWGYYRNLTDQDLASVWAYLRTLKPVRHRVDNTEAQTTCRLCRQRHGYGNRN